MKKNFFIFFICFITEFICLGQSHVEGKDKNKLFYDDWPITVESNANMKKISIEPNARYVPIGTIWEHRIITYFFQNGTEDIVGNNEREAIRDGFALWSVQTDLFFLEVCTDEDADIVISWEAYNHGDVGPFDGEDGILAHTLGGPPPNEFGDQAGDIHFDDSETWTLDTRPNGTQPIDLVTVAAHEIGHALGLNHTTISGSLMLAEYTGSHRFLGSDDIAGIRYLYGLPQAYNPISGPSIVCSSGASFTITNLPPVDSIIWIPGPYITISSGQNTSSCTFYSTNNNSSWVTARLVTSCGNITLPQKYIWAGTPRISVTGPDEGYANTQYTFQAHTADPDNTYPFSYSWAIYPNDGYISTYNGGNYAAYAYITFYTVYSASGYNVYARAQNSCGTGAYGSTNIWIHDYWLLSPNPASENVNVTLQNSSSNPEVTSSNKIISKYSVSIIDFYGTLYYSSTESGTIFTLPVNNLKNGTYVVRINNGKTISNLQLIVKH